MGREFDYIPSKAVCGTEEGEGGNVGVVGKGEKKLGRKGGGPRMRDLFRYVLIELRGKMWGRPF